MRPNRYSRFNWIIAGCLVIALLLLLYYRESSNPEPALNSTVTQAQVNLSCPGCNIILLNIELLRADHVGLISGMTATPSIDSFFFNGIVFSDVMAPAGETFISNTSVLTMSDPFLNDIRPGSIDKWDGLSEEKKAVLKGKLIKKPSIAEHLQKAGYKTTSINQGGRAGKNAFLDRGFDNNYQFPKNALFGDMTDLLNTVLQSQSQPYFILFRPTFLHNHQYRHPAVEAKIPIQGIRQSEYSYVTLSGERKFGIHLKRNRNVIHQEGREQEYAIYSLQLQYGDNLLSGVFNQIVEKGLENTVVVLYSNHGSALGDNGVFEHGVSYQSSVHVPILIRHPNVNSKIQINGPVSLMDLMPSLLKMVGIETVEPVAGSDLYGEIQEGHHDREYFFGKNGWDEYARRGPWKLIIKYGRFRSLFNLESDPHENNDIISSNQNIARELEARLLTHKLRIEAGR